MFWLSDMLGNTMLRLRYPAALMEPAATSLSELSFDTQCSRSAQGTPENMNLDLEVLTWDVSHIMDLGPYPLSANLCKQPCSIKGVRREFIFPAKEMRKLLEHLPEPNETLH